MIWRYGSRHDNLVVIWSVAQGIQGGSLYIPAVSGGSAQSGLVFLKYNIPLLDSRFFTVLSQFIRIIE